MIAELTVLGTVITLSLALGASIHCSILQSKIDRLEEKISNMTLDKRLSMR